jgi:hypothetical protein
MDRFKTAEFQKVLSGEDFLIVCSSSFEKRSLTIPRLASESKRCTAAYVFRNEENIGNVGESADEIVRLFGDSGGCVDVWGSDPVRTTDSILAAVRSLRDCGDVRVIVDVSAMMRETLLILLASLRELWPSNRRIEFAYVPAEYNQSRTEPRPQLSFGVLDVRSVIGFPGEYLPVLPRHLVLITGFETDRARAVINATDPSIISLGIGVREHSTSDTNATLDQGFASDLLNEYPSQSKSFDIYPDSAIDTQNAIHEQIGKFSEYKPLVCAMNTKVSTCGAALAAWHDPRIELIYAQPALYNHQDYADPKDEVYLFELPLTKI